MATSKTYIASALGASDTRVTLAAYTAPGGRAAILIRFDDEICRVTDTSSAPTIGLVRGYMGTQAVAHEVRTAAEYGTPNDFPVTSKGSFLSNASLATPTVNVNTLEVTSTGTTSTDAALVPVPSGAFLNVTGATSSGVNFPYPAVGDNYTVLNKTTGTIKLYSIGATINGTTGTTSFDLTITGTKTAVLFCATAGAWQVAGNS